MDSIWTMYKKVEARKLAKGTNTTSLSIRPFLQYEANVLTLVISNFNASLIICNIKIAMQARWGGKLKHSFQGNMKPFYFTLKCMKNSFLKYITKKPLLMH